MVHFLDELSDVQREAVMATEGPSLIIAGAGSGKTRVLTFRIANLLTQGTPPWSILALTFTNKAAREMKERIAKVVGESTASQLWMGTFHSMFLKILKYEADKLGYSKPFSIYDTTDSKNLVSSIIKELNLDTQIYKNGEVFSRISSAKNNLITPQAYASNTNLVAFDRQNRKPEIARIYALYAQRCFKASAMDFDDLLLNTNILFRDFPDILAKYQQKFKFILVDEYQDTNYSQYLIVKKLAAGHNNVCVVGDDAQSIYSFRGAKIENILNFRNDYPTYKLYKLEENYRSTQNIVNAANSVISKNSRQIKKVSFSSKEEGDKIKVLKAFTDQEEGYIVASEILSIQYREHAPSKDFAILYRTNAQSRIFEEALRKRNIPYRVYGSLSFYQRKEIKDILAYFRLSINPSDDEALKRVINYPTRGIGNTTMEHLAEVANAKNQSIWVTLEQLDSDNAGLKSGAIKKLKDFIGMMRQFQSSIFNVEAYESAYAIAMGTGTIRDLKEDKTPDGIGRFQNVGELLNGIKEFTDSQKKEGVTDIITLTDYMENVSLLTDADTQKPEDRDKVTVMTIHSAKGLEFNYVFLTGVEEDLFPSKMTISTPDDLEEERRLFYVAITRAAKKATISYAQTRYKWGNLTHCVPSRFISEIDSEWVDMPGDINAPAETPDSITSAKNLRFGSNTQTGLNLTPISQSEKRDLSSGGLYRNPSVNKRNDDSGDGCDPSSIVTGMQVSHERFGVGKVINVEGEGQNCKATIFFQSAGQKQLLLKFARLKIIG
ncbi:MAG: UvrD-helicase domain-containing protein [Bacteroidales bacterium]|nr:UvrD-helicase domain-containing protein [Bacteroidales bacterium]